MQTVDKNVKSVRFSKEVDSKLVIVARKLGRTKRDIIAHMIDYFYRSKKDPSDLNDEMLKKELSSGISRILSFIRKQEDDLLLPIFRMSDEHSNLIKLEITLSNKIIANQTKLGNLSLEHKKSLIEQRNILDQLSQQLSNKQALKLLFKDLLEYYIKERESLGWQVSTQKREELAKRVRIALDKI